MGHCVLQTAGRKKITIRRGLRSAIRPQEKFVVRLDKSKTGDNIYDALQETEWIVITLKEAYSKVSGEYEVGKIYDCGDFWLSGFAEPADISATAMYKNGERFLWFPSRLTAEQRLAFEHAEIVPLPE